jgi:PleD family two-component response regulator
MPAIATSTLQGHPIRVLLVGAFLDSDLLGRTLDGAGFTVQTATIQQALDIAFDFNPRILILGEGLAVQDRIRFIRGVRQHDSSVRVILLYRGSVDNAELADAVLNVAVAPKDLVQTIQELTC